MWNPIKLLKNWNVWMNLSILMFTAMLIVSETISNYLYLEPLQTFMVYFLALVFGTAVIYVNNAYVEYANPGVKIYTGLETRPPKIETNLEEVKGQWDKINSKKDQEAKA